MTTVAAVIQARLGSSRLPGKVLADLGGRPVLAWVVGACRAATSVDHLILTIPTGEDALAEAATTLGVDVVEGPEHDLLTRYQAAARAAAADVVVRITADCPLLDPTVVDQCVREYLTDPVDYQEARGYPRGAGDADLISAARLLDIDTSTASAWEREHVGPWFLNPAHECRVRFHDAPAALRRAELRVCVDEQVDLDLVRTVVERLRGRAPTVERVIEVLDADDALRLSNAHVEQRS